MKTFDEFVAYCRTLIGEQIKTAGSRTTFTVLEKGHNIHFVPAGRNAQEPPRRDRTEEVLRKLALTNDFSPKSYSKDTRQASYILGVMARYMNVSEGQRLPAEELRKVTAKHCWDAVQQLLDGRVFEPFGDSVDYDLITDEGLRLPPKAVFGVALGLALDRVASPSHFTSGEGSVCFDVLRSHGYQIGPKGFDTVEQPSIDEFDEGSKVLRMHAKRERSAAAAKAKKAEYFAQHGKLGCERCDEDLSARYGAAAAACIEVHHAKLAVSEMPVGYRTKLADLQCLCANCHRVVHHELRVASSKQPARS
jgi:hypothetical protein